MALHRTPSVLCLVTALLAVSMGAQAFRTPTGRAAETIKAAEAPGSRPARHAEAHISAEFKPGPEYRAYTELDDLTEYTGYKKVSKRSKGPADKPKGSSKPVHNPFLDDDSDEVSKPKYSHEEQPYPEPRPDYEPADDRQYKDRPWIRGSEQYKDDQLQPWIRGSGKDEEYKETYQPYEAPSAKQQRPYDGEGRYNRPSHDRPAGKDSRHYDKPSYDQASYNKPYTDKPSYGGEDYKPYSSRERPGYQPEERPHGRDGHDYDSKDSRDDSYGGYKDESYNSPDSYDSYDSGFYGEPKARLCLQEQSRVEVPETTGQTGQNADMVSKKYTSKFQCCSPADAPDACLAGNKTDSPYSYYSKYPSGFRSDSLLDTYLAPTVAATCVWEYTNTLCPPHLLKTCLGGGKLTCSLPGDAAKECGAPSRKFQFVAEGWFIGVDALSCAQYYGPSAAAGTARRKIMADPSPATAQAAVPASAPASAPFTAPATAPAAAQATAQATAQAAEPATTQASTQAVNIAQGGLLSGVAWKFQGTIKLVRRDYGFEEGRGIVEFVAAFGQPTGGFANGGRRSGRHLLAEAPQSDDKAAAPAATTAPAAAVPAAAAPSGTPSKSGAQTPAAAAAPAQGSANHPTAAQVSTQAPAIGSTSTQTQAAAPTAAGSPTKVQSGGAYFVDDEAPYGPYDSYEPDLPIVKGGSLHITLFDDYSDKDSHRY